MMYRAYIACQSVYRTLTVQTGVDSLRCAGNGTRKAVGLQVRGMLATAMAVGMFAATAVPAAAVQAGTPAGARRQLDVRDGVRTPVPEDVRDARHELTQRLGIEAHVGTDPVGGGIRVLDRTDGFLSGPRAGDPADSALAYVRAHADVFGLSDADLAALRLSDRSTSNDGVTHLTWVPESGGVPAYDSALRVHVAQDGSVAAASGPPLGGVAVASARPQLTASQALAIAQTDVGAPVALPRSTTRPGPQRLTALATGSPGASPSRAAIRTSTTRSSTPAPAACWHATRSPTSRFRAPTSSRTTPMRPPAAPRSRSTSVRGSARRRPR